MCWMTNPELKKLDCLGKWVEIGLLEEGIIVRGEVKAKLKGNIYNGHLSTGMTLSYYEYSMNAFIFHHCS